MSALNLTKAKLEKNGIGVMHISTFGESGIASTPMDMSMVDNATEEYSTDVSTSKEKEDTDIITAPLARLGAEGGDDPDPQPDNRMTVNFGADRSAPQATGTALTLKAVADGGVGSYKYQFKIDNTEVQSGSSATYSWKAAKGAHTLQVVVTDSQGHQVTVSKQFTGEGGTGVDDNVLTAKSYSLTLAENIKANIYVSLSSDIMSDKGAKLRITYPDGSSKDKLVSDYSTVKYNNEDVKKITYETVPAELTSRINICAVRSNGATSNSFSFAPTDYLYKCIEQKLPEANLAKALLNYGAYAQLYFGINTSDLANKKLTDNAVAALSVDTVLKNAPADDAAALNNEDIEYIGSALVCKSGTDMKLYFKNKNNLTLEQLKIKYALDAYDITLDEGMLCIRINNVYPGNLSAKYTIVINGANGTISGDICPMAYVRKGVQSSDTKQQNLCKAMYLYNRAALEYLGR